ncbi:MAG: 30S ribosomal protein S15 [Acidobacteria bacterium]|nr:30S ribosomal protein S15 [Acidobacteriota bacterium]
MALAVEAKKEIVAANARHKKDVGSTEVQVALLSARITQLTHHFQTHKKDHSSRRGLLLLVAQRRKLLDYLKCRTPQAYQALIAKLGIRK